MSIGALPRRCRPRATRTGTLSSRHSRSTMPWQLNRSITPSRYFRLPSKGLARALDELELELELELIQTHMTQKPVLRVQAGACRFAQHRSKDCVAKTPSFQDYSKSKIANRAT